MYGVAELSRRTAFTEKQPSLRIHPKDLLSTSMSPETLPTSCWSPARSSLDFAREPLPQGLSAFTCCKTYYICSKHFLNSNSKHQLFSRFGKHRLAYLFFPGNYDIKATIILNLFSRRNACYSKE